MTGRTRRQFLAVTGVTLAAALATNPARAQLTGHFVPQGKPSNKHMPRPQAVHGKGVMEEDIP